MKLLLLAATGGAIGAAGRYGVGVLATRFFGIGFPWGTLIVNVVGSFLMGALIAALVLRSGTSNEMRTFLATGVLGGFTTFSAFSLDAVSLYERGEITLSLTYIVTSVVASILALVAGLALVRSL